MKHKELRAAPPTAQATLSIRQPYTLAEIKAKIASNDYSAELLLQHAMLLLEAQAAPKPPVAAQDYPESPMKKVAQALREKAAAEREAFDRRIQSGEWGTEPDTDAALAQLRHLYDNLANGGVRDTAQAKRIAEGLLAPAIAALERAARHPQPAPAPLSESEYKRGYRDGYERRDAEVRGALV